MIINSRYVSVCRKCNGQIEVGEQVVWTPGEKGVYHANTDKCFGIKPPAEHYTPAEPVKYTPPPPKDYSMKPLADVMQTVMLKRPTLRLNSSMGEVVLSMTRGGVQPGSVAIKIAGNFIGCVRPNGECSGLLKNQNYADLRTHLLNTVSDKDSLIRAALDYAKLTNNCCFCGLTLTNDFSVVHGYGPICAENWGLPHALNGDAEKIRVSGMTDTEHMKFMELLTDEDDE
jgi:hypothetical protein